MSKICVTWKICLLFGKFYGTSTLTGYIGPKTHPMVQIHPASTHHWLHSTEDPFECVNYMENNDCMKQVGK